MISIIVPVYNAEKYISECIHSILNQTYTDWELLLIDDGSRDASYTICEKYAKQDNRIKLYKKENGGVSSARNYGLDHAKGDYIGFVDSDDIIHPDMYRLLYEGLTENQAEIAYCDYCEFMDDICTNMNKSIEPIIEIMPKDSVFFNFYSAYDIPYVSCCTKLISSRIFKNIRFDGTLAYGEDNLVAMRCFYASQKVVRISNALYYYRKYRGSATKCVWTIKNLDSVKAYFKGCDFWEKEHENKYCGYCITKAYKLLLSVLVTLPPCEDRMQAERELKCLYKKYYPIMKKNTNVSFKNKIAFTILIHIQPTLKIYIAYRNKRR